MNITNAISQSISHTSTVSITFDGDTSDLIAACVAAVGGDCDSTERDVVFGTDADGGEYQLRIVR